MKTHQDQTPSGQWAAVTGVADLFPTSTLRPQHHAKVGAQPPMPDAQQQKQVLANLSLQMIQCLGQAVLIVDRKLFVRFSNRSAQVLLQDNPVIRDHNGILSCISPKVEHEIESAIQALSLQRCSPGSDSRCLRMENAKRGTTVVAMIRRYLGDLSANGGSAERLYVIALHQLGRLRRINTVMLEQAFNLTRAEASIAGLLAQGYEPCQIAAVREVSIETVRAQLRNVFAKTSANRQADVVRLVIELSTLAPDGS